MITGQENSYDLSHWVGHTVSTSVIVGYFAGWLPALAATVAFLWYLVQLYESHTVQRFLRSRRERKITALSLKLARLQAQRLMQQSDPARSDLMLDGAYRLKGEGAPPGDAPQVRV